VEPERGSFIAKVVAELGFLPVLQFFIALVKRYSCTLREDYLILTLFKP
jgi:hypothetical protein